MGSYKIITGNEACARAAIASGMRFFAGYPITPATAPGMRPSGEVGMRAGSAAKQQLAEALGSRSASSPSPCKGEASRGAFQHLVALGPHSPFILPFILVSAFPSSADHAPP